MTEQGKNKELIALRRKNKYLLRLLEEALDVIPDFTDGRNDRLFKRIDAVVYHPERTHRDSRN